MLQTCKYFVKIGFLFLAVRSNSAFAESNNESEMDCANQSLMDTLKYVNFQVQNCEAQQKAANETVAAYDAFNGSAINKFAITGTASGFGPAFLGPVGGAISGGIAAGNWVDVFGTIAGMSHANPGQTSSSTDLVDQRQLAKDSKELYRKVRNYYVINARAERRKIDSRHYNDPFIQQYENESSWVGTLKAGMSYGYRDAKYYALKIKWQRELANYYTELGKNSRELRDQLINFCGQRTQQAVTEAPTKSKHSESAGS